MKMSVIQIVIGGLKGFAQGTRGLGNKRTSGDHTNYSIIKIDQNTK